MSYLYLGFQKVSNHYIALLWGVPVYYIEFEGCSERFMTLDKKLYKKLTRKGVKNNG